MTSSRIENTWHNHAPRGVDSLADDLGLIAEARYCSVNQLHTLENILDNIKLYIKAGDIAARATDRALFDFFFLETDRKLVRTALKGVYNIINSNGPTTVLFCRDFQDECANNPDGGAYHAGITNQNASLIVLCPLWWQTYDLPDPCGHDSLQAGFWNDPNKPRNPSKTYALYHEILHTPYIAGPTIPQLKDISYDPADCHSLVTKDSPAFQADPALAERNYPAVSIDNHAHFAEWAWIRSRQQQQCPSAYPLWNITKYAAPVDRVELRKLLNSTDGDVAFPEENLEIDCQYTDCSAISNATLVDVDTDQAIPDDGVCSASSCSGPEDTSCGLECTCVPVEDPTLNATTVSNMYSCVASA